MTKTKSVNSTDNINSSLILRELVFDRIEFTRKGFKNENKVKFKMEVQTGTIEAEEYKVTLILTGNKEQEYDFSISLSGFFNFDADGVIDQDQKEKLINANAIAILMPYIRSEVSLLTAQPGTECVVLPPFNIKKLLRENE